LLLARILPGKIAMIVQTIECPFCHKAEPVVKHGTNHTGSQRCRCKDCHKTFTPQPCSRSLRPETRAAIERALAERLAQRAIARCFQVSFQTIRKVAQDAQKNTCPWQTV
jgi:transposase-like protein